MSRKSLTSSWGLQRTNYIEGKRAWSCWTWAWSWSRTRQATTDVTVADDTFDARINKEYPGYQGRHGPTEFPPQDADMWRATTKGTQSRWQRTALHAWTSCVTQFCRFRVNQLFSHFGHSFTSTELLGANFHWKKMASIGYFSPGSGRECSLLCTKTRRIQALRMKPLWQGPCVMHQWKPHLPADSLLAFEWMFFVPESRKSPPNLVNKL